MSNNIIGRGDVQRVIFGPGEFPVKEPHIHTPAHDPPNREKPPELGSPSWWRRLLPKEPDWWRRVFSQPFDRTEPQ